MGNRGFWQELKRRHVYRVAAAYAVVGWLLIQIATQVFPVFHLPDWLEQAVVLLILIGFPIALVLAWAFDATPHGIVTTDAAADGGVASVPLRRRSRRTGMAVGLIGVLIAAIAGGAWWQLRAPRVHRSPTPFASATAARSPDGAKRNPGSTAPDFAAKAASSGLHGDVAVLPIPAKSIAVLPFENLSTDKGNAYFADGMQDLILTKLADIGDLKVISRTSTMQYGSHPQNLKIIAQQLGVATILEGSVQKADNQVLINVQLIDARTDGHIWAQSYQRTLDNIFGVEGEVAQKVAEALKAKLSPAETARVASVPTQNVAAYDLFLQGQYYETRAFSSELKSDYEAAVKNYRAALRQDPQFALAWARLAFTQVFELKGAQFPVDAESVAAQVKTAVEHSLALDPTLAEAHVAQGWYRDYALHDLPGALASFKAALALQPQNADASFAIGVIHTHLGQMPAALEYSRKAVALDPRNVFILDAQAWVDMAVRRYTEAEQATRRAIAIDPASALSVSRLAHVFLLTGDLDQAQSVFDAAPASVQDGVVNIFLRSQLALYRGNYAVARQLLAKLPDNGATVASNLEPRGDVEWAAGDRAKAREHYQRAVSLIEAALEHNPDAAILHSNLGWAYARLGRNREALAEGELAVKLSPMDKDALFAQRSLLRLAQIQVQLGEFDNAVIGLDRLLALPAGLYVSVPMLKLDPTWDPIRKDPRFQALLKQYGNGSAANGQSASGSTTLTKGKR